jgi:hypothetical protein
LATTRVRKGPRIVLNMMLENESQQSTIVYTECIKYESLSVTLSDEKILEEVCREYVELRDVK